MKLSNLILPLLAFALAGCATAKRTSVPQRADPETSAPPIAGAIFNSPPPPIIVQPTPEGFTEAKAKVRALRGNVKFSENGEWKPLRVNDTVTAGTSICTDADSSVELFLNYSRIRLDADSILSLQTLSVKTDNVNMDRATILDLKRGKMKGDVQKLSTGSNYQIKTSTGMALIRGADFAICANGKLAILSGSAVFAIGESNYLVSANQVFNPAVGATKKIPRRERPWQGGSLGSDSMTSIGYSPFAANLEYARYVFEFHPLHSGRGVCGVSDPLWLGFNLKCE